jgi:hypothetical protein
MKAVVFDPASRAPAVVACLQELEWAFKFVATPDSLLTNSSHASAIVAVLIDAERPSLSDLAALRQSAPHAALLMLVESTSSIDDPRHRLADAIVDADAGAVELAGALARALLRRDDRNGGSGREVR